MHHHSAKLSCKSFVLALLVVALIVGVLAIAPALGWRTKAVSTVRTRSSALTQPTTISQQEPTPPPAAQSDQDLLKQTLDKLRERRLVSAQMFDLDMDSDPDELLDPDKGWLLNRQVFEQLSSAGQRAALILNGHGGGRSSGGRGPRGAFGQNLRVNDPAQDIVGVTQSESSIIASGHNIVVAFNDHGL